MSELIKTLKNISPERNIYIWGAGFFGTFLMRECKSNNINITGFIDKKELLEGRMLDGITIFKPDILEKLDKKPFLVLAMASGYLKGMEESCIQKGFVEGVDYYATKNHIEFRIDVSGTCNLICPSCPRGNSPHNRIKGFVDLELFKKLVNKIQEDYPDLIYLPLFVWGEPFLHPHLAECITYLKEKNIYSVLSSNLSVSKNLDEVLRINPDWLKVSLSGYYPDVYNTTHTGGNINLVKSNLYKIRYLIDKYKLATIVEVNYHRYLNNTGKDLEKIRELCEELDFILHDVNAFYMPMERRLDFYKNKHVENLSDLMPLFIDKEVVPAKDFNVERLNMRCSFQTNQILIDCNGQLQLCCVTFDDMNNFDVNYLDTSLPEIIKQKLAHKFCIQCKGHGLISV